MSADAVSYLDSSALVKLVVREAESAALIRHLRNRPTRVSCALARVEVVRAVRAHGAPATARARELIGRIGILQLDEPLLDSAAELEAVVLRSLDAIHLAAARALGDELREIVTYDLRMAEAGRALGLAVATPS